eukprot:scaffold3578_cov112-Isochrysis_galbana.AAC.1
MGSGKGEGERGSDQTAKEKDRVYSAESPLCASSFVARCSRLGQAPKGAVTTLARLYGCPPEPSFEQRMRREHEFRGAQRI